MLDDIWAKIFLVAAFTVIFVNSKQLFGRAGHYIGMLLFFVCFYLANRLATDQNIMNHVVIFFALGMVWPKICDFVFKFLSGKKLIKQTPAKRTDE